MDFSAVKTITIPEGVVTKIISAGVTLWEVVRYINQVFISIGTDGNVYNAVGYKNGYRIRSGGAEDTNGSSCCTGFIPCKAGDVIRFRFASGAKIWTDNTNYTTTMNFSDSGKSNLGQFTSQPAYYGIFSGTSEVNNVKKVNEAWEYTVTDNANICFVRFSVPYTAENNWLGGADLIVTVNEEIV